MVELVQLLLSVLDLTIVVVDLLGEVLIDLALALSVNSTLELGLLWAQLVLLNATIVDDGVNPSNLHLLFVKRNLDRVTSLA